MGRLISNNTMRNLIIVCLVFVSGLVQGQKTSGRIIYETSRDIAKTLAKAKFLSKEEKDRESETMKNWFSQKTKYALNFTEKKSFYTFENQQETTEDGSFNYTHDDFYLTRDFEKGTYFDYQNVLGKTYIVEDSLNAYNWKIMNDVKDVAGYICMKALAYDALKDQKIEAWFCTDFVTSSGPDRFYGLPGVILEVTLDDGAYVISALSVDTNSALEYPKLPKKVKGKKINTGGYTKIIADYIKQSEAMHRLPWWLY